MLARVLSTLPLAAGLALAQAHTDTRAIVADLHSGNYIEARTLLDAALKASPHDPRLWTLDGLALERLGDKVQATVAFERALRMAPDYVPALEGVAQLAYEEGSPKAAGFLQRLANLRPEDRTAHAMLAQIAFKSGNCDTAKSELANSQPPGSSELAPLHEYGACLIATKRVSDAAPVFEQLRHMQPENEAAAYDCAVVEFLAGHFGDAVNLVRGLKAENADALDLEAEAYERMGEREEANTSMRRAIALKPDEARFYADFAYLSLANGDAKEGLAVLNGGLARLPDAASLFVARGVLYSELGEYERGDRDFEHAQKLDPNVELLSAAEGLSELQRNDLPVAEATTRERLRRDPKDALLNYVLAEVLVREGAVRGSKEFNEALTHAETAVRLKPDLVVARDALGRLYLKDGKYEEAVEQSRIAYQANPNDAKVLYQLITALRKANRTAELPELFQRLAALRARAAIERSLEAKQ